jgi:hypothetical protein
MIFAEIVSRFASSHLTDWVLGPLRKRFEAFSPLQHVMQEDGRNGSNGGIYAATRHVGCAPDIDRNSDIGFRRCMPLTTNSRD